MGSETGIFTFMKYLLILLFIVPLIASGQIVIQAGSFPQPGDTLFTHIDYLPNSINIKTPMAGERWDFSTLQSPFARKMDIFPASVFSEHRLFPKANAAVILKENQLGFFHIGEREISLMGLVGDDLLSLGVNTTTVFDPPLIERRVPLRYQEGHQTESFIQYRFATEELPPDEFEELPFTPDSIQISITLDRQDYVDAWGTLLIPGGIYDVLRERREELRSVEVEAKIGRQAWQNVTDLLSDNKKVKDQTSVSYYFHSNESVNPVAIVYMDREEQKVVNVAYNAPMQSDNIQQVGNIQPGLYAYPNPAIVNVRFEFTNLPPGNYKLTISNILGLEEWSQTYYIDGHRTERVNIASLRKGSYLYSLKDEKGKTISTKRLIIIKP
jgi:hypothetical protein